MSPFNWFRRDTDGSAETPADETSPAIDQAASPQADQSAGADDSQSESATTSALDYLEWAKAAYKNIQDQQGAPAPASEAEAPEPSASDAEEQEASQAAPEAEAAAVDADTDAADVDADPDATGAPTPPAPPAAPPDPPELAAAETTASTSPPSSEPPEPEPEPEPAATAFWAKAEAARQERMERLQAEAEAAAAAEAAATPTPETPATASDEPLELPFDLDEGFLWSAEILAAQGRRPEQVSIEEITWLKQLRQGLDKTRRGLVNQLKAVVGQGPLNQAAVMEIEALLLQADVGIEATDYVIEALQNKIRQEAVPPDVAITYLKTILRNLLDAPLNGGYNATFAPEKDTLNIWLMTGVNGAGKTTTIGKIAHLAKKSDYRVLIAAADTFRAAAVQQVKVWGDRSNVEVIANPGKNTDPAAVVYDAIAAAESRQTELLLVDTAGRLQNKKNLMEELSKIRRIVDKKAPQAKVESLLVLDATLGQNGLRQAEVFAEAASLSGVVLTKLDGTAKGGIALAVVKQLGLPIRFIGAGEGIEDLRPFSSYEFIEALLNG